MNDAKDHGEPAARTRDEEDFARDPESQPSAVQLVPQSFAADHARLTQALRDVRHLLGPDGVAIVDQALARTRFNAEAPLFEPSVEPALSGKLN